MNAAARVIMNLSLRDHVKPALKQLHWLPVEQRITYKLCLFMHHIHTGQAPQYLSDCVSAVSALSGRYRLRSTGLADYVLPRTRTRFGERGFSYCGPSDLHDITDTGKLHSENDSRVYFIIVLTIDYCCRSWKCRIAAPYKFHVDWLIYWLILYDTIDHLLHGCMLLVFFVADQSYRTPRSAEIRSPCCNKPLLQLVRIAD